MTKETWYCNECGSLDIRHDAVAWFNPETEVYEILGVLDESWCEDCGEQNGSPVFGTPAEITD